MNKLNTVITRREFLSYAWLGTIFLFILQSVVTVLWYMFPNYVYFDSFGGFRLGKAKDVLPKLGSSPILYEEERFWLVHTDAGVLALYTICPHLGCLIRWSEIDGCFICPCFGSKFALDGTLLSGPSSRGLDRFVVRIVDETGWSVFAETDYQGNPVPAPPESFLAIDIGFRILGNPA